MPSKGNPLIILPEARKPKFRQKETKWEKKRRERAAKRRVLGKKPLAEPLVIAPAAERKKALQRGLMVFYANGMRVELPLVYEDALLQGAYMTPKGQLIVFRAVPNNWEHLVVYAPKFVGTGFLEVEVGWFSRRRRDLGHMKLDERFQGLGLAKRAASKAERHARALSGGRQRIEIFGRFERLFNGLGYRTISSSGNFRIVEKTGKPRPRDDLFRFHRIEAIDPKTGKARIFTFRVQGRE